MEHILLKSRSEKTLQHDESNRLTIKQDLIFDFDGTTTMLPLHFHFDSELALSCLLSRAAWSKSKAIEIRIVCPPDELEEVKELYAQWQIRLEELKKLAKKEKCSVEELLEEED